MIKALDVYRYCPRCKTSLSKLSERALICPSCDFPFHLNPLPCNGILIKDDQERILLVKREREPKRGSWDLPGGFIDGYESFEESIKREAMEELGVEVTCGKIIAVTNDKYIYRGIEYPSMCINAEAIILRGEIKVSDDASDFKYYSKNELKTLDMAFSSIRKLLESYLKDTV